MLGFKLANVYDGSALGVSGTAGTGGGGGSDAAKGVYMFKLADPSGGAGPAAAAGSAAPTSVSGEGGGADSAADPKTPDAQEATAVQDQKRAMLLIESGVRFHPTT